MKHKNDLDQVDNAKSSWRNDDEPMSRRDYSRIDERVLS